MHARRVVLEHEVGTARSGAARASRPSGRVRSRVRSRLLVLEAWKSALYSHQSSRSVLTPLVKRMPSGRVTDSTWTTSAPSAASIADADGPAHHAVRSSDLDARAAGASAAAGRGRPSGGRGTIGAGVLAQARRRARRRRSLAVDPPRARGARGTCRSGRRPASRARSPARDSTTAGPSRHRRHRDPQLGRQRDDLGGRVLRSSSRG